MGEQSRQKQQLTNSCFFTQRKYMEVGRGKQTKRMATQAYAHCYFTHTHTHSRRNIKILGWPESSFRVSIRSNFLANPISGYIWLVEIPRWPSDKQSTCQEGNAEIFPGSRRSPGKGNGNPLQYSCLGNPMNRGTWRATVHGFAKESDTTD